MSVFGFFRKWIHLQRLIYQKVMKAAEREITAGNNAMKAGAMGRSCVFFCFFLKEAEEPHSHLCPSEEAKSFLASFYIDEPERRKEKKNNSFQRENPR